MQEKLMSQLPGHKFNQMHCPQQQHKKKVVEERAPVPAGHAVDCVVAGLEGGAGDRAVCNLAVPVVALAPSAARLTIRSRR